MQGGERGGSIGRQGVEFHASLPTTRLQFSYARDNPNRKPRVTGRPRSARSDRNRSRNVHTRAGAT